MGNKNVKLLDAAKAGDLAQMVSALKSGANVNSIEPWTAENPRRVWGGGHSDFITLNLTHQEYENGETALIHASELYGDRSDLVTELLNHHADVTIRDAYGQTPLLHAVQKKNKNVAQLLLTADTKHSTVNVASDDRALPLHEAAKNSCDDASLVDMLLRAGADVNALDMCGYTPLLHACIPTTISTWAQHPRACLGAMLLLRWTTKSNVNHISRSGVSPLTMAASSGNCELIEELISQGADVNFIVGSEPMASGMGAIHIAAAQGFTDVIDTLLRHGTSIELHDAKGRTALHHAAFYSRVQVVDFLLGKGARANSDLLVMLNERTSSIFDPKSELGRNLQKIHSTILEAVRRSSDSNESSSLQHSHHLGAASTSWIQRLNVPAAVQEILAAESIDETSFEMLTETDLEKLRIPMGPRKILLSEIQRRQKGVK